jgi:hypothetical protein
MKLKLFSLTIVLISLYSCGNKYPTADDGVYFQDYDNLWMFDKNVAVTSGVAHSGNYSAYTDSSREYSQTFEMDYRYAREKGYKALKVSAWVYTNGADAKGNLVASVEGGGGTPAAYESAELNNFIERPKEWTMITSFLKFPDKAPDGAVIKVYLWAPKKHKIYLDDMLIELVK